MTQQIHSKVKKLALTIGWKLPFIRVVSSRKPVILLYHDIPTKGDGTFIDDKIFEQHIVFLKQHFELIVPDDLGENRQTLKKIRVLLTFDDGFRNNAEVVAPILRKHHIPAVFFVCSRHATPGKYLWFSYLFALEKHFRGNGFCFRGEFMDMSPSQRQSCIQRLSELLLNLTPHPSMMYQVIDEELPRLEDFIRKDELINCYAGMTAEQVGELAADPLFSIGAHTVDHPFLTKCGYEEALQQIKNNKLWVEQVTNKQCATIAYPSGDYNAELLKQCGDLGFTHGYATIPRLYINKQLELPRIGIYKPSLDILGFKVQWGNIMRALGVEFG
jgi:peptidoglycan/xylan/chitin deacetylase (PgdA/CDA1 family)